MTLWGVSFTAHLIGTPDKCATALHSLRIACIAAHIGCLDDCDGGVVRLHGGHGNGSRSDVE